VTAFIPFSEAESACEYIFQCDVCIPGIEQRNADKRKLLVGEIIICSIKSLSANGRTCTVAISQAQIFKSMVS
jgi:hypothetical protein